MGRLSTKRAFPGYMLSSAKGTSVRESGYGEPSFSKRLEAGGNG